MARTLAPAVFRFFVATVERTQRLSPSLVRVTLGGAGLQDFASGGRDQSFSLFLPQPGQREPVLPDVVGDGWFAAWRAMDPQVRAVMRSYTVREQRRTPAGTQEVDVDFALHGDIGPASRWAVAAQPGDPVTLLGPTVADNKSVGFRPPPSTEWILLAADETALPALAGILDWLPAGTPTRIWIEVPDEADRAVLPYHPDADVECLVHQGAPHRRGGLAEAVRNARLPSGTPYAWLAGEASGVRALRRHLVTDRGFPKSAVDFTGYWRLGATEETFRQAAG